jgi:hypothetical protein
MVTCATHEMLLICRTWCSGVVGLHVPICYTYCALLIKPFEGCLVLIRLGGADATVDPSGAQATSASKHGSGFPVLCTYQVTVRAA